MTHPYKVTVTAKGNDITVNIEPKPVATSDDYLPMVTGRFQNIIVNNTPTANTILGRMRLKKQLNEALKEFHEQNLIKPKEE